MLGSIAIISLVLTFGTLIPPPNTAYAVGNEPWLYSNAWRKMRCGRGR